MNTIIQHQHIHSLFRFILLHQLEQFPVKIPQIHHVDILIMGREQRNQAVGIRILDDKQRLTGIVSRMNLNKCMIVIQEKSILVLGIQIIRCIQRINRVRKSYVTDTAFFSVSGKYCMLSFVQSTLIRDCRVP